MRSHLVGMRPIIGLVFAGLWILAAATANVSCPSISREIQAGCDETYKVTVPHRREGLDGCAWNCVVPVGIELVLVFADAGGRSP